MSRFFNNYVNDNFIYNNNRRIAFDAIKELVQSGTRNLTYDLTNDSFNAWFEYSKKILELATKDNPNILLNYLRLSLSFSNNPHLKPTQKLSMCLDYLLRIMEIL